MFKYFSFPHQTMTKISTSKSKISILENSVFSQSALLIFIFSFLLTKNSQAHQLYPNSETFLVKCQLYLSNPLSSAMVTLPVHAANTKSELLCKHLCSLPLRLSVFQNQQQKKCCNFNSKIYVAPLQSSQSVFAGCVKSVIRQHLSKTGGLF